MTEAKAAVQQIKICSPLKVTAITCDADGGNFGRLLEWDDSNGSRHEWAMPMTVLAGAGQDLREVLALTLLYQRERFRPRVADGVYRHLSAGA